MFLQILFLIVSICCADVATAQSDEPNFTSFGKFQLGKITLSEVVKAVGPAKIIKTGDAGESKAEICYRIPEGIIYFLSGEMGGQDHELLGFAISINDSKQQCANYPENITPKMLHLGDLKLGQTKKEFARVVGVNVRWRKNIGRAYIERKRNMNTVDIDKFPEEVKQSILVGSTQNYFDVGISIVGTFVNNKLTKVEVWKVETY